MPKRRRPRGPHPELRPEHARPLDPEAFRIAAQAALAATTTPHPLLHERVSPHMVLHDGEESEALWLTDIPMNWAMITLRDYYEDRLDYTSANWRLGAIGALADRPELAPWIAAAPQGGYEVADAVFYVAATAPLNARGEFWIKPFRAALVRWEAEHPEAPDGPG
jgi:hypothetical protein